mmetsp:Transcript_36744/g.37397  ORF Transcript_36744/g.37397 Transcript_36744/m.37397 type:complete len:115 (+) Transcript_36744:106-450(+)
MTSNNSLDDFQENIDDFVLKIFEAVRTQTFTQENLDSDLFSIRKAYEKMIQSVDNLDGIDKTIEDQKKYLDDIQTQYHETRLHVLQKEQQLHELNTLCNAKIEQILEATELRKR